MRCTMGTKRADAVFAALPIMLAMFIAQGYQLSKEVRAALGTALPLFPSAPFPRAALLTNLLLPCLCLQLPLTLYYVAVPFLLANLIQCYTSFLLYLEHISFPQCHNEVVCLP